MLLDIEAVVGQPYELVLCRAVDDATKFLFQGFELRVLGSLLRDS